MRFPWQLPDFCSSCLFSSLSKTFSPRDAAASNQASSISTLVKNTSFLFLPGPQSTLAFFLPLFPPNRDQSFPFKMASPKDSSVLQPPIAGPFPFPVSFSRFPGLKHPGGSMGESFCHSPIIRSPPPSHFSQDLFFRVIFETTSLLWPADLYIPPHHVFFCPFPPSSFRSLYSNAARLE